MKVKLRIQARAGVPVRAISAFTIAGEQRPGRPIGVPMVAGILTPSFVPAYHRTQNLGRYVPPPRPVPWIQLPWNPPKKCGGC